MSTIALKGKLRSKVRNERFRNYEGSGTWTPSKKAKGQKKIIKKKQPKGEINIQ